MTEDQANEILKKVGRQLIEADEYLSAISVLKLGEDEYNLKIIASPTDPDFSFDNELDFQKEFKKLSERISNFLQDKDFKLSRENFPDYRLPDVLFKDPKFIQFKNRIRFLSPEPCEYCKAGRNSFSLGLIIKRTDANGKCYILFSAHSIIDVSWNFHATRLLSGDGLPVETIEIISDPDFFDLAIAESDFKSFMEQKTSIGKAHHGDIIMHYGCGSGMQNGGKVTSPNSSIRIDAYIIENLIELEINSAAGNSGAPVLNERNQTIGLIHSGTDSGHGIDITFCTNLHQAREEHLLDPYYKGNSFYLATK